MTDANLEAMPLSKKNLWFRIGYAVESLRAGAGRRELAQLVGLARSGGARKLSWGAPAAERETTRRKDRPGGRADPEDETTRGQLDGLARALGVAGVGALALQILQAVPARRAPGLGGLMRAGVSGAVAALLVRAIELVRHAPGGDPVDDPRLVDAVLGGAARGLLYGQVIGPRLPGPAPIRGLAYGLLEVGLSPWGGLDELLAPLAPHRRIPLLRAALGTQRATDDSVFDHLLFGTAMALLAAPRPAVRIGTSLE